MSYADESLLGFWGVYPTMLRIINFATHMLKFAAMAVAFYRTGSGKLAPASSQTPMDTAVTCAEPVPGPFGETMLPEAIMQSAYAVVQFWKIARGQDGMGLAEKALRGALGVQAVAHARSHFITGNYVASWEETSAQIQDSRDESTLLLNVMSFIFLGFILLVMYWLSSASPVKAGLGWAIFPTVYTAAFFRFYFNFLDQKNQYLFMNELVNGVAVPWIEAYNGLGWKPAVLVETAEWQRQCRILYYVYIAQGITQWVEHRWCQEMIWARPHFWFDMATFATFEAAVALAKKERNLLEGAGAAKGAKDA